MQYIARIWRPQRKIIGVSDSAPIWRYFTFPQMGLVSHVGDMVIIIVIRLHSQIMRKRYHFERACNYPSVAPCWQARRLRWTNLYVRPRDRHTASQPYACMHAYDSWKEGCHISFLADLYLVKLTFATILLKCDTAYYAISLLLLAWKGFFLNEQASSW